MQSFLPQRHSSSTPDPGSSRRPPPGKSAAVPNMATQPNVVHEQQHLVAVRRAAPGIQAAGDSLASSLIACQLHQQHPPGAAFAAMGGMTPQPALEQLQHASLHPPQGLPGYQGLGFAAGQAQEASEWQGGPPAALLLMPADGAFSGRSVLPPQVQQQRLRAQLAQQLPAGAAPPPGPTMPWTSPARGI
jgi:hypothetical protein